MNWKQLKDFFQLSLDRKGTLVLEACNRNFSQKKKLIESCVRS